MDDEPQEVSERNARDDGIAKGGLPAGLEPEGRDESLTRGDLVHPSGSGPGGHTTPPGTSLPDEPDSSETEE